MTPYKYSANPPMVILGLWRNRGLVWQLTKREVMGRYRGSIMGLAWSFFNPVLMVLVYTFVFSVVFKARWGVGSEASKANFAVILFAGIIVHRFFAECINRAPGLILSNVNYVKKVVFPLEILPWVSLGSALFDSLVNLAVLLLAQLVINHVVFWTSIFVPLVLLPLIFFAVGFGWFLSALGVYVRDIGQITNVFTMILLFLSPVFYSVSALPQKYQLLLYINPLTVVIEEARKVLIFGSLPDLSALGAATLIALVLATCGFWWFQKSRKGFADVL
jgi:lipopolysaccharide transport system permease protein